MAQITGTSGTIAGTNVTYTVAADDGSLVTYQDPNNTSYEGWLVGYGGGSEITTVTFSEQVQNFTIEIQHIDNGEDAGFYLDGAFVNLNTAIADGSATVNFTTGPATLQADGYIDGAVDSTLDVINVTIKGPATSIGFEKVAESPGQNNGITFSLDVEPICFTNGTMIEIEGGEKLVDDLEIGDMVRTLDNRFQPVRFIYKRKMAVAPKTRPVLFEKGAIGNDRVLRVSQKHRFLVDGIKKYTKIRVPDDSLVWASALINGTTIRIDNECTEVEYYHIMLDKHELVYTHGVVSESWQPHRRNLKRDKAMREELLAIFPEIMNNNSNNSGKAVRERTFAPG